MTCNENHIVESVYASQLTDSQTTSLCAIPGNFNHAKKVLKKYVSIYLAESYKTKLQYTYNFLFSHLSSFLIPVFSCFQVFLKLIQLFSRDKQKLLRLISKYKEEIIK